MVKQKATNDKIVLEMYRRMYAESEPKGDIDKIILTGEGKMPNFFVAYYLPSERIEEIILEVCKEFNVPKRMWSAFSIEINLGSAPCSYKPRTEEVRKDYEEKLKQFLFNRQNKNSNSTSLPTEA